MPQNYQFVENLIQLRQHYQSLNENAERDSNHATEQLDHINALLVDQLGKNQLFVDSLLQLRSHYQSLRSEHQQQANSARELLNHVTPLLADQAALQHNQQQPISIEAATLEQLALSGANPEQGEELQKQSLLVAQKPKTPEISDQQITSDVSQGVGDGAMPKAVRSATIALESKESPQPELEVAEPPETPQVSQLQVPKEPNQVEHHSEREPSIESPSVNNSPERSPFSKPAPSAAFRQSAPLKTPLLPQYQHLTKSEAIENLLHEHSGTILHLDFIIRALYGELTPEEITAEKPRITDSLKKGVAKGLWDRVPDEAGCYTADIKLVDSEAKATKVEEKKPQRRKLNSRATEGMLPRYQNMNFTEAVESVLRDAEGGSLRDHRSGEVVTTDIMARALYGELKGQDLVEAKKKVGKILWSGANQGRWQSVPGQAGAYTLSLKKQ